MTSPHPAGVGLEKNERVARSTKKEHPATGTADAPPSMPQHQQRAPQQHPLPQQRSPLFAQSIQALEGVKSLELQQDGDGLLAEANLQAQNLGGDVDFLGNVLMLLLRMTK